ncbi:MAG: hypothetical protein V1698_02075 [bacterium]
MNANGFIQGLKNIQNKIQDTENQISRLEKEKNRRKANFYKLHECQKIKGIFPIPLEDFVPLIPKNNRPEIIPVWNRANNRILLLRSQYIREFAFPVWAFKDSNISSTRYKISLNINGVPSCQFSVVCACCFHGNPEKLSGKEYENLKEAMGKEFKNNLILACQQSGIRILFMRRPEDWKHGDLKEFGIGMHDCNHLMQVLDTSYTKKVVKDALIFIDWERSTLIDPDKASKRL